MSFMVVWRFEPGSLQSYADHCTTLALFGGSTQVKQEAHGSGCCDWSKGHLDWQGKEEGNDKEGVCSVAEDFVPLSPRACDCPSGSRLHMACIRGSLQSLGMGEILKRGLREGLHQRSHRTELPLCSPSPKVK